MTMVSGRFAALCAAVVLAAACPSIASAQRAEVTSSNGDSAELLVYWGARSSDIRAALTPYVPAGYALPTTDAIADANRGRMRFVCYDQAPGERPSLSRDRAFYDACEDFARDIWYVAHVSYHVRFVRTSTAGVPDETASAAIAERDSTIRRVESERDAARTSRDQARAESEARIANLEHELEAARAETQRLRSEASAFDWAGLALSLLLLVVIVGMLYWLKGRWERDAASAARHQARKEAVKTIRHFLQSRDEAQAKSKEKDQRIAELERLQSEQAKVVQAQTGTIERHSLESVERERDRDEAKALKDSIKNLFEAKAKLRPLEKRIGVLRLHIRTLKRLLKSQAETLLGRFTTPVLTGMINEAELELRAMDPKPSVVLREMARIRKKLAKYLPEIIGFAESDQVLIDADLRREKDALDELQTETALRKQMYERLMVEILKVATEVSALRETGIEQRTRLDAAQEFLQQELALIGEERSAMQAEAMVSQVEIQRLNGELQSARRMADELRKKLNKQDDLEMLSLIELGLTKADAKAKYQGQVKGNRRHMAEVEAELAELHTSYDKRCTELAAEKQEAARLRAELAERERTVLQMRAKHPLVVLGYDERPPRPGDPSPTKH